MISSPRVSNRDFHLDGASPSVTSTSAVTFVDVSIAGIPAVTFARVESPRVSL